MTVDGDSYQVSKLVGRCADEEKTRGSQRQRKALMEIVGGGGPEPWQEQRR